MGRVVFGLLSLAWLCVVVAGFVVLQRHDLTPGRSSEYASGTQWPTDSSIPHPANRATLVVLAHPKCPCTRATITELARLMARCHDRIVAYVLFYKPLNSPAGWESTDTYDRAAGIPGVHTQCDENGAEARRFHATTSGQCLLYDSRGKLLFNGGITSARGHEGDNAGEDAVLNAVLNSAQSIKRYPVFGCALF